eukprot:406421_1
MKRQCLLSTLVFIVIIFMCILYEYDQTFYIDVNIDPIVHIDHQQQLLIFQIGFNKMGTQALANFFALNRITVYNQYAIHNPMIINNLQTKQPPLMNYAIQNISYFGDFGAPRIRNKIADKLMNHTYFFQDLLYHYPNRSTFILNIRNVNHWMKSRMFYLKRRECTIAPNGSIIGVNFMLKSFKQTSKNAAKFKRLTNQYKQYICDCIAYFYDNNMMGNLVLYDIEQDKPDKLINFFFAIWAQIECNIFQEEKF